MLLIILFTKHWYETKKNRRNYLNFVLYYQIIRIAYFMEVLYQKDFKIAKLWKTRLLFYGCHGNGDAEIILIMISNDLQ